MGSKDIFATDPRGRPVELWDIQWDHVVAKHPDVFEYGATRRHFKKAIEEPADGCIYESHKYADCDIYYVRLSKYFEVQVVVRFENEIGEIKTAHLVKERPKGETIRWMKGQ